MIWLVVLVLVVLAVVVVMRTRGQSPTIPDDAARRAAVGLHLIRRRLDVAEFKRELRRDASQLRRELDRDLK